jgi:hypothetical protein
VKGRVTLSGKFHCCFILRNFHSHPNLQQPPPLSVSSHQHRGKDLHQITTRYMLRWWLAILSNKLFLIKVYTLFYTCYCTLNRLQYSVNINFIYTGKPKNSCNSLYCDDLEPNLQYLRSIPVCTQQCCGSFWIPFKSSFSIFFFTWGNINSLIWVLQKCCRFDKPQCSQLKINRIFGEIFRLYLQHWRTRVAACCMLVFCLAYSSTLKMEVTYSSGTSLTFQRTIRRYISEDRIIHNHICENPKSCTEYYCSFKSSATI